MTTEELPLFIDSQDQMSAALQELSAFDMLAMDTEFDSYYSYQDQICLVQISSPQHDYIFDPLALDLKPLAPLFKDPQRTTIFHAGMNDIPLLRHEFGFEFGRIFDTYLAAGALNYSKRGLAVLLEHYFGIVLDKVYQRADWRQRPLPPAMLQYARYDTKYLFALRESLLKELNEKDHLREAEYAFKQATRTPYHPKVFNPDSWPKLKGIRNVPRQAYGMVRELLIWRDHEAQLRNLQPFRIMPEYVIVQLAINPPRSVDELLALDNLRFLSRCPECAPELYKAIKRGTKLGAIPFPKKQKNKTPVPSAAEIKRHHELKAWRNQLSQDDCIAPEFILSNQALSELAHLAPRTLEQLRDSNVVPEHILDKYGEAILRIINT